MTTKPLVSILMGSQSDWDIMRAAPEMLAQFSIPYEIKVISAHRAPDYLFEYINTISNNGVEAIIAGAGGAAHLPGVIAAKTAIPVLGVPMPTAALNGMDSLLSIVQMPAGIPVATFAIGKAGATNAALFAVALLANKYPEYKSALENFREKQTEKIVAQSSALSL